MASAQPQLLLVGLCWTSSPLLHGGFRALCTRTGILLSAVPPAAAPPPPCRGLDGLCRWMGVARALAPLPTLGHALAIDFPPPLRGGDQIRACSPLRPVLGRVLEARCCFCSSEQCSFFNLSFFFCCSAELLPPLQPPALVCRQPPRQLSLHLFRRFPHHPQRSLA